MSVVSAEEIAGPPGWIALYAVVDTVAHVGLGCVALAPRGGWFTLRGDAQDEGPYRFQEQAIATLLKRALTMEEHVLCVLSYDEGITSFETWEHVRGARAGLSRSQVNGALMRLSHKGLALSDRWGREHVWFRLR